MPQLMSFNWMVSSYMLGWIILLLIVSYSVFSYLSIHILEDKKMKVLVSWWW